MADQIQLCVDGIPVTVCRKKIKNMHLRVKDLEGNVSVSVPMGTSEAVIEQFVLRNREWIGKQQQRLRNLKVPPQRAAIHYTDGEVFYLWGVPYVLRVEEYERGRNSLELMAGTDVTGDREPEDPAAARAVKGKAVLRIRRGSSQQQREAFVKGWYRDRLSLEIKRLLPKWETAMGLHCLGWQSKDMKTRWGTCNVETRKIWLNLQLVKLTPDCLEYVIVHELTHLRERSHNAYFWSIVEKYIPEWREIRKKMNCG